MKHPILVACIAAAAFAASQSVGGQAGKPVDDASLGLAKGSVFDVPTPQPFVLDGKGAQGAAKAAYGAPPLIPHTIDDEGPISASENSCLDCHDRPKPAKAGARSGKKATPMPALHYAKGADNKAGDVKGDYYNCVLCHAPAAAVKDLVANQAPKPARR